jgi:AcrR family transcriptional regulator
MADRAIMPTACFQDALFYNTDMSISPLRRSTAGPLRPLGRPRTLTLDSIIVAAVDVGLEHFTMSAVAARLGVGVATLYTYVESRDALKTLVASRNLSIQNLMEDKGQPWQELVAAYAGHTYRSLSAQPQLLVQYIEGAMAPAAELFGLEYVLAILVRRGFTVHEAYELYQTVSLIAMGAALGAVHIKSMAANGTPYHVAARVTLHESDESEVAYARQCAARFADDARYASYEASIADYMHRIATARGERLSQ